MDRTDEQALARYRYMLQTAPPEEIERAHEEAFARLTPDQRRQALAALAQVVPPGEIRGDDPASLARTATRAEVRQPGTIERAWGSGGGGIGHRRLVPRDPRGELHRDCRRAGLLRQRPGPGRRQCRHGRPAAAAANEADSGSEFGEGDVASGDIGAATSAAATSAAATSAGSDPADARSCRRDRQAVLERGDRDDSAVRRAATRG